MASYDDFHGDDAGDDSTATVIHRKSMVGTILLLFMVLLVVLGLNIYARFFWGRRSSSRRRHLASVGAQNSQRLQRVGLDKSAIETIPVFVYQSENQKDELECAVCLCKFDSNEKGRLLPKCHHSFHIDCIDMWLQSHSTCPLCRTRAQPDTLSDSVVVLVADEESASGRGYETDHQAPLPTVSEGSASTSMELGLDIDLYHSCRHEEALPIAGVFPKWTIAQIQETIEEGGFTLSKQGDSSQR